MDRFISNYTFQNNHNLEPSHFLNHRRIRGQKLSHFQKRVADDIVFRPILTSSFERHVNCISYSMKPNVNDELSCIIAVERSVRGDLVPKPQQVVHSICL